MGRGIQTKDFDKVATHVVETMKELGVEESLINEVVALLTTLKGEVSSEPEEEVKEPLPQQENKVVTESTLFSRLGGESAIKALVDGMYVKILSDPVLADFFRKTNMDN